MSSSRLGASPWDETAASCIPNEFATLAGVRTLTRRELNRALLARQLLLTRSDLPLPRALEQVAGIQAQYAPSMYVALWSRLTGFQRHALTDALVERTVVQATLMRMTIHLVSREDFWPFALATRETRRAQWLRTRPEPISARAIAGSARKVRGELSGGNELRRSELEALVGKERALGSGLWVDLVRAPPSGTWERRRADLFALADEWIGPPEVDPRHAAEHLLLRYLRGFGPASRKDVASFTGIALTPLARILARLELRRFASEDGEELLDVPGGLLPDPDTPAPPRFIGTWDATLLTHARRTGVLPEEHRPRIFNTKAPHSYPTFLIDGAVAGTWRHADGEIELSPFAPLAADDEAALREEAARLAAFHA
jgi:Winged helix DNA-binding domain